MSLLPRQVDVYTSQSEIFKPLTADLNKYVRKIQRRLSPDILQHLLDILTRIYKYAPAKVKETIPECRKTTQKMKNQLEKFDDYTPQKQEKIRNTIHSLLPSYISDLTWISKELSVLAEKEEGNYYANLPSRYEITLGQYDNTGNSVEFARNPLMVSVHRPLTLDQMETTCKPEQLETFLYVLNKALLIGFNPSLVPTRVTEEKMKTLLYKTTGKSFSIVPVPLKHASSSRIWFLIDELSVSYRSIHFADRELVSNNELIQKIVTETKVDVMASLLLEHGFDVKSCHQLILRLNNTDDMSTKYQILSNEISTLKRLKKTEKLRKQRQLFQASQAEIRKNITLLQDDYEKTKEDKIKLTTKFKILTSPDADPEKGLTAGQYKKIDKVFRSLERSQTRNVMGTDERNQLRKGLREARIEAREVYYELKMEDEENRRRMMTINKLINKVDNNRKEFLYMMGGQNVSDSRT